MRGAQPGTLERQGCCANGQCNGSHKAFHMPTGALQSGLAPWLHLGSKTCHNSHQRCRSRCVQPLTAAAVATLPFVDAPRPATPVATTPARTASQLLQNIASSTDWRYLQGLYEQHHSIMTTAHVAAIAMQLPRALNVVPDQPLHGPIEPGLHGLYDELMPRLEGQLHVLPARLLLGVASALDVCNMPYSSSWRAAFLSAAAILLAPPKADSPFSLPSMQLRPSSASSPAGSSSTPATAGQCSPQEVLSLARHVFLMYSGPGCVDEALSSAALTERLISVTMAAATAAAPHTQNGVVADAQTQARLAAASEAAACMLADTAALSRPDAFPARIIIQLLESLKALQVTPSQKWLSACHSGLQVTARPPQMKTALALLTQLGWKPADPSAAAAGAPATAPVSLPPITRGTTQMETFLPPTASTASKKQTPGRTRRRSKSKTPGRRATPPPATMPADVTRTADAMPAAPNSALEGMISLLRDAAASKMLPELKATVFSQLEGCDPALVLWTAEAFHQLGTPLTGRELAQCVHLAVSAVDSTDRGSAVPAWDVLALIQRCCNQGAAVPPGQLEHLLDYVTKKTDQLQPSQLADTLSAAAGVVARSSPPPADADAGTPLPATVAVEQQGAVSGSSIYVVMEALRPVLASLTGEQAARVAASLTSMRACGMAAALPLPVWLNAYCSGTESVLNSLNAQQLRQVLTLLARSGHFPSATYLEKAVEAARATLATVNPASQSPAALLLAADAGRSTSQLGDVLAVLELLVLDLGCEPSQQLAVDVAAVLAPALSSQADQLSPAELSSALRLLAAMRCRPSAGAVQKLLGALERWLFQLSPGRLALVSWACAELGAVPRRAFLSRYLEAAAESLAEMRGESLALLARSFAQLGIVPDASWQRAYRDAVLGRLPESDAETMSVLGQGLLHLGLRPDEAWIQGYIIESTYKMPEADAASVARFAHFMASCGSPPPWDWVKALMERTLAMHPDDFDPPDLLPLVLRSLLRLGWAPDPAWLNELLDRMTEHVALWQPSSLIITATSIATLQSTSDADMLKGDDPGEEAYVYSTEIMYGVLDAIIQTAASKVHDFNAYELRWLLDPLQLLPGYSMPEEAARTIQTALAAKEAAEQNARLRRQQGMPPEEEESQNPDVCHESIAMGLNDLVSDVWLTSAVMV